MRAVEIDEAHLVVEWQLFYICLSYSHSLQLNIGICKGMNFSQEICFGDKNVTNKILNLF